MRTTIIHYVHLWELTLEQCTSRPSQDHISEEWNKSVFSWFLRLNESGMRLFIDRTMYSILCCKVRKDISKFIETENGREVNIFKGNNAEISLFCSDIRTYTTLWNIVFVKHHLCGIHLFLENIFKTSVKLLQVDSYNKWRVSS